MNDPTGDLGISRIEAAVMLFGWPAAAVTVLAIAVLIAWIHVTRRKP